MNRNRTARGGPARGRNAELTRAEIVKAAARHFAARGYAHVTLQEIAADADVTAALINRYFGSKRALFEVVASAKFGYEPEMPDTAPEWARRLLEFWDDVQARTPAVALVRSVDLDGGTLLQAELEERFTGPLRAKLGDRDDSETILRLMASLTMGLGLFGIGAIFGRSLDDLSEHERDALERKLTKIIEACLTDE
ncbi:MULTISPECIES: TetR/AcrR family transcriptional regulator [Actinomadura]|uniref:DNA-binding transcriptional regulator, AcrR family n=1 Tax=Actinomadura madurae TaxID=1993 RepID=A0A1I5XA48_9ACTN|nr:TetR/AcrR family transcriptional regulator [Actinomadura madurae]SFQ28853.1 DNA-binding transcriptional regulator, AcrR family [Actinomadura madurae]SPT59093.1 transcriptional regulator BetI [Actinomadura madurae]